METLTVSTYTDELAVIEKAIRTPFDQLTAWQLQKDYSHPSLDGKLNRLHKYLYDRRKEYKQQQGKIECCLPQYAYDNPDMALSQQSCAIYAGALLNLLGIQFAVRVAQYSDIHYENVYIVIPFKEGLKIPTLSKGYYTLEPCNETFDEEAPWTKEESFWHGNC